MYYYGPPAYGQAKAGRPARTYIQQLCEDTGCNPEDLPKAMNDREKWRERVRDIGAGGTTWWWWWWWWWWWYACIQYTNRQTRILVPKNRTRFLANWMLLIPKMNLVFNGYLPFLLDCNCSFRKKYICLRSCLIATFNK